METRHASGTRFWLLATVAVAGCCIAGDPAAAQSRYRPPARSAIDVTPAGARPHRLRQPAEGVATDRAVDRSADSLPELAELKEVFDAHFEELSEHEGGDLLTRAQAAPLAEKLKRAGWTPTDWKDIIEDILPETDPLVRLLGTESGRRLTQRIGSQPGAFDRLDRLRKMPYGERRVRELMTSPGGEELLKYLTSTTGGKEMGRQLSRTPGGRNFNEPTGRIYTAADLWRRLEASYRGPADEDEPNDGDRRSD